MKNYCYFCDFCKICGLTKAPLDLFSFRVQNFVKFVILAIFKIFVAQSFHIGRKILVTFAIFAKFADISKPFLTFSLSKYRILWNLLFLLFLPYLLLNLFKKHEIKILVTFAILRNLRTSRSPSWPFLFLSVEFCEICYSFHFCHICCLIFSHSRKNSCYSVAIFFQILVLLEALLDLFSF